MSDKELIEELKTIIKQQQVVIDYYEKLLKNQTQPSVTFTSGGNK